ncbi:MAG TPA: hypothetical protein VKU02_02295 [Gemmataceae bacterium]|nr:hypothetical protein [Gemmataceae bacterium]
MTPGVLAKLAWSLPWLSRYPFWRARELLSRVMDRSGPCHLIFLVVNHFEPSWNENGEVLTWATQRARLDDWVRKARAIGQAVRDSEGTPYRHTYFYPAEQYHVSLLEKLAELQSEGLGEIEIHLHHGVDKPDNPANCRQTLETFRDILAQEHKCLSRCNGVGDPMYGFVHGNLALANSSGGRYCGVDSEMQILAETGCYADFTLPAAPLQPQVPRINAIYQCGHALDQAKPHRSGPSLRVGVRPQLPVIFTGPLVFNWRRRVWGFPVPRLDDGVLMENYPLDLARLRRWRGAHISVRGRPEWIFIKLYCHGFFPLDQAMTVGEPLRRFMGEVLEYGHRSEEYKIHFATAREAFNIVMAAVDGHSGEPGQYRDYLLRSLMKGEPAHTAADSFCPHANFDRPRAGLP